MPREPVLAVLLLSTLAAVFGALGALPFGLPWPPSRAVVGGAYALASGLMFGAGYLLLERGLDRTTIPVVVGAGKRLFYQQVETKLEEAYRLATEAMVENMMTEDAVEGIDAFAAKRRPRWKNK